MKGVLDKSTDDKSTGDKAAAAKTRFTVSAYEVPTDHPESGSTFKWDSATLVLVDVTAGGETDSATATPAQPLAGSPRAAA